MLDSTTILGDSLPLFVRILLRSDSCRLLLIRNIFLNEIATESFISLIQAIPAKYADCYLTGLSWPASVRQYFPLIRLYAFADP